MDGYDSGGAIEVTGSLVANVEGFSEKCGVSSHYL
jgi:hypothetical protein